VKGDIPDLPDAVRGYAAERRGSTGPHLDVAELAAYDRGELDEERRARIREHLAVCPECTRWLLDLHGAEASEPSAEDDAVSAAWQRERDTAWGEIQRRIGGRGDEGSHEAAAAGGGPTPARLPAPAAYGRPAVRHWATAVLAAACVILSVLLWQARTEIAKPRPVTLESLAPEGSGRLRGGGEPGQVVVRPSAGDRVVLVLAYVGSGDAEGFTAEIHPPPGEGPVHGVAVGRRGDGTLAVELGAEPAPGEYRIVLFQGEGDGAREVATYRFRVGLPESEP